MNSPFELGRGVYLDKRQPFCRNLYYAINILFVFSHYSMSEIGREREGEREGGRERSEREIGKEVVQREERKERVIVN